MAKVISPLHSVEARGRMGGVVANTWRGISYMKASCAPAQPRSALQLQIRAWSTMLVRAWESLTDGQRAAWNDYAASHPEIDWTGNPKRLTGLNWWLRNNIRSRHMGLPGFVGVPAVPAPDPIESFAAAGGVCSLTATWTATEGDNINCGISLDGPHTAGRQGKLPRARHNCYEAGESGTQLIEYLIPGVYTVFARALDEDNGLASAWVSDVATVTA